jgi:non-ribosomal peptide synthetase component F
MIVHSTARLILTDKRHCALARKLAAEGTEIINIDDLDARICGENLDLSYASLDPAYIVYTSGSTGQPREVLHSHRNVLYSVFVESNAMHICREDRIGLLHSFSSSASTKFLFAALLNGASLRPFDIRSEGFERLRLWMIREGITLCDFTASLFRNFARSLERTGNSHRFV